MATKGCRGLPKALHSLKLLNLVKIAIKGNKGQQIPLKTAMKIVLVKSVDQPAQLLLKRPKKVQCLLTDLTEDQLTDMY